MSDLTISDQYYHEILTAVGYPTIDVTDLEMSDNDIQNLFILPALRTYFFWFPIQMDYQQVLGENDFQVAFPPPPNPATQEVFGVVDVRVNTTRYRTGLLTFNPLINSQNIAISSKYRGMYGTSNNYDMNLARVIGDMERQSVIDMWKGIRVRLDLPNKQLVGYTNIVGQLSVQWAIWSTDFGDVPMMRLNDAKMLAQAYVLRGLGMIRGQLSTDSPSQFNYQMMLDRADKIEETLMNRWSKFTRPVILRA